MSAAEGGADAIAERIAELLPGAAPVEPDAAGERVLWVSPDDLEEAMAVLRADPALGFTVLVDLTAVDHLDRVPRFDVVYALRAPATAERVRVKVAVDGESAGVASVSGLWPAAGWLEREVWDLYGIAFAGHPDLRRILLDEKFEGHPLRKDHPKRGDVLDAEPGG